MGRTVAVLCVPPVGDVVGRVRLSASKHLARRLRGLPSIDAIVVATPDVGSWGGEGVAIAVDPPTGWRFGEQLAGVVEEYAAERLVYFSAGSGLLLTDDELSRAVNTAPCEPPFAVLNNFYSTDFALIVPPEPELLAPLARDNPLGFRLWEKGYRCYELPRTVGSQFDLDTAGELQLLACHPELPVEVRECLEEVPTEAARALLSVLTTTGAELVLVGRVGGVTMRQLELNAACRVRLFSEERGMEAEERVSSGRVRSLLGMYSDCVSPQELVDTVCALGDVVVWDTRVIMAHRGLWPPARERFAADLLQPAQVSDAFLREFVSACAGSGVPMILGGHSLVSGGLLLAMELAWREKDDRPRRCLPLVLSEEEKERKKHGT